MTHFVVDVSHEFTSKFKTHFAYLHADSDRQPNVTLESLTAFNYRYFNHYTVGELCEKPIRIPCLGIISFKIEANKESFCANIVGPLLHVQ